MRKGHEHVNGLPSHLWQRTPRVCCEIRCLRYPFEGLKELYEQSDVPTQQGAYSAVGLHQVKLSAAVSSFKFSFYPLMNTEIAYPFSN